MAEVEGKINALTERLREKHLRDLDKGKYPASSGVFYNDLVNDLEKCGDRVASVATHLASEEGRLSQGTGNPGVDATLEGFKSRSHSVHKNLTESAWVPHRCHEGMASSSVPSNAGLEPVGVATGTR